MKTDLTKYSRGLSSLLLLGGLGTHALAQTTPDAGSLLQQNERGKPPEPRPAPPPPSLSQPPATLALPDGARVRVQRFVTEGNALLDDAALQAVLAAYVGRSLGLAELQRAAAAVSQAYEAQGWIARVTLPPQDVTEGVVRLKIVESRAGRFSVEGKVSRLSPARAEAMARAHQQPGQPLNVAALDRALLLIDDLPGVSASGALVAGQSPGETDLIVKLEDRPRLSGSVAADNGGGRSTGAARASADIALNSALGLGDLAQLLLNTSQGSDYLRLAASLPVGLDGWRVGVSGSALRYHLIGDDFALLQAKGNSATYGLDASYPILRRVDRNLYLQLAAEHKRFNNQANGASTSRYGTQLVSAGLSGNSQDARGNTSAALTLDLGRLNLAGSANEAADASTTQPAGAFRKLRYTLNRQQVLTPNFSGYLALAGQTASRNLDSSEKFYLGGPQGVRAYPVNEAGGSSGQMVNAELRARLPGTRLLLSGFIDWGHVQVNVANDFSPGAASPNSITLKGAGLSLAWQGPHSLNLMAALARRIGSNPDPGPGGRDQDGSLQRHRFWLQASLPI